MYQHCIQPTYEELKRVVLGLVLFLLVSIQPTYEELKHIEKNFIQRFLSSYPAYLWGIETPGEGR